jgi:hypothetical protein
MRSATAKTRGAAGAVLALLVIGACGARSGNDLAGYVLELAGPDASVDAATEPPESGQEAEAPVEASFDAPFEAGFDAPADTGADAGPDVEVTCIGPCLPGESSCQDGGVATCTKDADGCNVWGPPVACAPDQVCQGTLRLAACVCQPGWVMTGGTCVFEIGAPRQVAPLSTATVTSQTPTLHWVLAPATDGARVDLCHDRACANIETSFVASGGTGVPGAALSPGVHFWRLRGTSSGVAGTQVSPVWEFTVGARSAPVDTSWGTSPDVDGDGLSDVVVGTVNSGGTADYYVYGGSAGGVSLTPAIVHGPTTGFSMWGLVQVNVASAGDTNGDGYADIVSAVVQNSTYSGGAITVMLGGPGGLTTPGIVLTAQGTTFYDGRGAITATTAGDVNGDGYADIVATAAYYSNAFSVFFGTSSGPSPASLSVEIPIANGYVLQATSAGDVNGDGFGDIAVVATDYSPGGSASYLYLGGPQGLSSPIPFGGASVLGCAGDVNGDGLADVLVGAGVYYGDPSGLAANPVDLVRPASAANQYFGVSVATAGDTNQDGFSDIVVGAPDEGSGNPGACYVYLGSANGPSATPVVITGGGSFGESVSGAGDVDGDGYSDILVGSPGPFGSTSGQVSVFLGSAGGPSPTPAVLSSFVGYSFASLDLERASLPTGTLGGTVAACPTTNSRPSWNAFVPRTSASRNAGSGRPR